MFENLKFPANSMLVMKQMIKLATFNVIPIELLDELIYFLPENDAFNENFEMVGIESTYFIMNIGFAMWVIYFNLVLMLIHAAICKLRARYVCFNKLYIKISTYLYWNGLIRMYMELYFDLLLFTALNIHTMQW